MSIFLAAKTTNLWSTGLNLSSREGCRATKEYSGAREEYKGDRVLLKALQHGAVPPILVSALIRRLLDFKKPYLFSKKRLT